jgi:sugar phosphate permease
MLLDLNMYTGSGYNIINMCFFVTYVALQPAMILVCRKMGPRIFLPLVCFVWGGIIIAFGFAKTWPTMVPLRLILGALEAGYFPGCLYLISSWYPKCEFFPVRIHWIHRTDPNQLMLQRDIPSSTSLGVSLLHSAVR